MAVEATQLITWHTWGVPIGEQYGKLNVVILAI